MLGDVDAITFVLAERLGKTLGEIRALPQTEIEQWRAFYLVRETYDELHSRPRRR